MVDGLFDDVKNELKNGSELVWAGADYVWDYVCWVGGYIVLSINWVF